MSYDNYWPYRSGTDELIEIYKLFRVTKETMAGRYHESRCIPISKPENDGFTVYAGFSILRPSESLPIFQNAALVCLSDNVRAVELYMFSVRKYECLNTYKDSMYGGSNYKLMGNTGAYGVILAHAFGSAADYDEFMNHYPYLHNFEMSTTKAKIDKDFCNHLNFRGKIYLPNVVEDIITRNYNSIQERLVNMIEELKFFLLPVNLDNLRAYQASKVDPKTLENPATPGIFTTIEFFKDLLSYEVSQKEYDGKYPGSTLGKCLSNFERRSPILFEPETYYRQEIKVEINSKRMDNEYRYLLDSETYSPEFEYPSITEKGSGSTRRRYPSDKIYYQYERARYGDTEYEDDNPFSVNYREIDPHLKEELDGSSHDPPKKEHHEFEYPFIKEIIDPRSPEEIRDEEEKIRHPSRRGIKYASFDTEKLRNDLAGAKYLALDDLDLNI